MLQLLLVKLLLVVVPYQTGLVLSSANHSLAAKFLLCLLLLLLLCLLLCNLIGLLLPHILVGATGQGTGLEHRRSAL